MKTADALSHPMAESIQTLLRAGISSPAIMRITGTNRTLVQAIRGSIMPAHMRAPRQKPGTVAIDGPPPAAGITFAQAADRHLCLWEIGALLAKPQKFCGAPRRPHYPYCDDHCARAYVRCDDPLPWNLK